MLKILFFCFLWSALTFLMLAGYVMFSIISCNVFTHCISVADWRFVIAAIAGLSFHNIWLGYIFPYIFVKFD